MGLTGWNDWVDASTLTEEDLRNACDRYTVFGRVTPSQKKLLVEALKAAGHSVAMTGDGVNDIPALKAADCSIAMAGGSDAAKHAAQLTLLNADFAAMPQVVAALSARGFFWLLAGGVVYTAGGVIYALKPKNAQKRTFGHHELFHLFIMGGSLCHYIFMYGYLGK